MTIVPDEIGEMSSEILEELVRPVDRVDATEAAAEVSDREPEGTLVSLKGSAGLNLGMGIRQEGLETPIEALIALENRLSVNIRESFGKTTGVLYGNPHGEFSSDQWRALLTEYRSVLKSVIARVQTPVHIDAAELRKSLNDVLQQAASVGDSALVQITELERRTEADLSIPEHTDPPIEEQIAEALMDEGILDDDLPDAVDAVMAEMPD